jgi:nucleoside-diphosphate-sugar epimerase
LVPRTNDPAATDLAVVTDLTRVATMRVLVVGASGLLGRGLLKAFTAAGHEVGARVLVRARLASGAPKTVECPRRHKISNMRRLSSQTLCRARRSKNMDVFICARALV